MDDYKYNPSSSIRLSRVYICAPVPFEDLRFSPTNANAFMLGLVHSFKVTLEGPERGTIILTRFWNKTVAGLVFPSTKFFNLMRGDLKIPLGHSFNLYYQNPTHGMYLEGCDDSTATRSLMVDLHGEYEVTKFSYAKYSEIAPNQEPHGA